MNRRIFLLAMTVLLLAGLPAMVAAHTTQDLPEGTIKISESVPAMGIHWANPKTLPLGPIFGSKNGQITFVEYMFSMDDFKAGKSWEDLSLYGKYGRLDHVDIHFMPKGHEGFEVEHYDVHMYLVAHEEHMKY